MTLLGSFVRLFLATNPFIDSYIQSDWFGRWIFIGLLFLSLLSWSLLIYKTWVLNQVKKKCSVLKESFSEKEPLKLQFKRPIKGEMLEVPHPLFEIYKAFKAKALIIINRNHFFLGGERLFSPEDMEFLESDLFMTARSQMKVLESHVFILSTVVTLGPFIGLLGTVWGILVSFTKVKGGALSGGSEGMLAGLSLALTTTVIGLLVAIPALIGYSYLRSFLKDLRGEMESFSHRLISSLQLTLSKGEHVKEKTFTPE